MADIWDLLAPSALVLGGAAISANANNRAATQAGNAALQGAQIQAAAIREGNQAIVDANTRAQQTLDQIRKESAPATGYLRKVMAEPTDLTPLQQKQLEDNRRSVTNTIHNSSFAGSGRAAAGLFKRADADFTNEAIAQNVGRADNAAHTLYGAGTGATTGIAASQIGTGTGVAAGDTAIGKATGDAYGKAGLYGAQANLATGNVTGKAIGDIGSLIANQGRESRYADSLSSINSKLRTFTTDTSVAKNGSGIYSGDPTYPGFG